MLILRISGNVYSQYICVLPTYCIWPCSTRFTCSAWSIMNLRVVNVKHQSAVTDLLLFVYLPFTPATSYKLGWWLLIINAVPLIVIHRKPCLCTLSNQQLHFQPNMCFWSLAACKHICVRDREWECFYPLVFKIKRECCRGQRTNTRLTSVCVCVRNRRAWDECELRCWCASRAARCC